MAVAESAAETVLRATDTKTISRSATSAAGMSNNTGQPKPLDFQKEKRQNLHLSNGHETYSARSICTT
jgi:hypothetical protein